jgi:preprotein translocase subunit YajC
LSSLLIILAMFVLLWVLMIRPQRSRQRQQQHMIDAVEPGDEILTHGGLYGIVQEFDENEDLIVEIADGINVRLARRSVASVVKPEEDEEEEAPEEAEEPSTVDAEEGIVKNEEETVKA